jgi:hypothetical protein
VSAGNVEIEIIKIPGNIRTSLMLTDDDLAFKEVIK